LVSKAQNRNRKIFYSLLEHKQLEYLEQADSRALKLVKMAFVKKLKNRRSLDKSRAFMVWKVVSDVKI
jgi:hypothetical protein